MILYAGMGNELLTMDTDRPEAAISILPGKQIAALAIDPRRPDRVYCATTNDGLLRSVDAGNTWGRIGQEVIASDHLLSVGISPSTSDVLYAGTEPSALYRSDDGGDTWRELPGLQNLPSKASWSFPPKPDTHHVRWITQHPTDPGHVFVAIEAGALVQSHDGGETWRDRLPGSPVDTHTLLIHRERPERVLSAAGDGCFISNDRGETWSKFEEWLPYRYCYGLAVDDIDPDLAVMSVAPGAYRGHGGRDRAQASIVRGIGDAPWHEVSDGLPSPEGTTLSMVAAAPGATGTFFALNNTGVYRSDDGAMTWRRLDAPWKDEYLDRRPPALAIAPDPHRAG